MLNLEENESDYIVWLILTLMEACSSEEKVPGIICRILINNLFFQVSEGEIKLTPKHKELAMSKLESIRGEIIFDFVKKLELTE